MVLIWNDLSGGTGGRCGAGGHQLAVPGGRVRSPRYFYLKVLPGWLGLSTVGLHLSVGKIAETVAIFLGVPLVAGSSPAPSANEPGPEWYETKLLPRLGPFALYGLLYTIVILFASRATPSRRVLPTWPG